MVTAAETKELHDLCQSVMDERDELLKQLTTANKELESCSRDSITATLSHMKQQKDLLDVFFRFMKIIGSAKIKCVVREGESEK